MILQKHCINNYAQELQDFHLFRKLESISSNILSQDDTLTFTLVSTLNINLNKLVHTEKDRRKLQRIIINLSTLLTHERFSLETRIRAIEMIGQRKSRIIKSETSVNLIEVMFYNFVYFHHVMQISNIHCPLHSL